jgi:hypothetical protein
MRVSFDELVARQAFDESQVRRCTVVLGSYKRDLIWNTERLGMARRELQMHCSCKSTK